jgi:hypothetical protein
MESNLFQSSTFSRLGRTVRAKIGRDCAVLPTLAYRRVISVSALLYAPLAEDNAAGTRVRRGDCQSLLRFTRPLAADVARGALHASQNPPGRGNKVGGKAGDTPYNGRDSLGSDPCDRCTRPSLLQ